MRRAFLVATTFAIFALTSGLMAQNPPPAKTISGGVLNGKAISLPKPEYPEDARRAKANGTVKVQVLIDETGVVVSAKAVNGTDLPSFRQAAETAALKATFAPTLLSGQPAKVSGVITYNFVIETNEERLKVLGVSMFIGIARYFVTDWEKLKESFDGEDLIKEGADAFPEFAAEFNSLTKLENATPEKRMEVIDKALSSVQAKLDASGKWQYETGRELAKIVGPMFLLAAKGGEPDLSKVDEPSLKQNLARLGALSQSAPPDFPSDVLQKLKELAAAGNKNIFDKAENAESFFAKISALIETMSPEKSGS